MIEQECPMVVHAAQRMFERSSAQHSLQCALPSQEVTNIFPHVPSFPAGLLYRVTS